MSAKKRSHKDRAHAYSKEISAMCEHPDLTREEEIDLARKSKQGDKAALDRLIECNLRLVASICKKSAKSKHYPFEEAFANGTLGLISAAKNFDPERGIRFSTYATWAIRAAIHDGQRMIRSTAVTIPMNGIHLLCRKQRGEAIPERREATVKKIETAVKATRECNPETDCDSVGDIKNYDVPAYPEEVVDLMVESIKLLEEVDQRVLAMRYGLPPYSNPMTYQQIATVEGVSLQGARIREQNARERLKAVMIDQREKCQGVPSDN